MNAELAPYVVSLQRLLCAHGVDLGLAELCAAVRADHSLDAARRVLVDHGKAARVVQVGFDELTHLSLPTLVTLSDELPCLLRSVRRQRVTIERGHAILELNRASFARMLTGALEIDQALDSHGHFLRRLQHAVTTRSQAALGLFPLSLALAAQGVIAPLLTRKLI